MRLNDAMDSCLKLSEVSGLVLFFSDGSLVRNRLPDHYTDQLAVAMGERILNFVSGLDFGPAASDEFLIRFQEAALYIRRFDGFLLGVLTVLHPDVSNLRLATNLLIQQVFESGVKSEKIKIEREELVALQDLKSSKVDFLDSSLSEDRETDKGNEVSHLEVLDQLGEAEELSSESEEGEYNLFEMLADGNSDGDSQSFSEKKLKKKIVERKSSPEKVGILGSLFGRRVSDGGTTGDA